MDNCPVFLKKIKAFINKRDGITIVEILIVVAFLAVLAVAVLVALKPQTQLAKARDARRKADLQKLKNPLEDYYNDHKCYPLNLSGLVSDYLGEVPKDPLTKQVYTITTTNCNQYRIYTKLEYEQDPEIARLGCQSGCGPGGTTRDYNYGVTSGNVSIEPWTGGPAPTPTKAPSAPTPTPEGQYYGCFSGICESLSGPICSPNYLEYPNCDPGGEFRCGSPENPQNECT